MSPPSTAAHAPALAMLPKQSVFSPELWRHVSIYCDRKSLKLVSIDHVKFYRRRRMSEF